jgi:exodeoxyribonuclease VII large subunit
MTAEAPPLLVRPNIAEFTVGEIAGAVKRTLETTFERVRIRGEISRPNYHSSGHLYLTLKDSDAAIDGVCWRGNVGRLGMRLEEGMEVIATGRISSYPRSSKYQLVIESVELAGEGALLKLLEDRRRKLAAEGLFASERKQKLPYLPTVIGVVTSPTGAVIRDILHRLADRFPRHVLLWPVPVQGDGAAEKIAAAIRGFNALPADGKIPRPDVLIVARGGGSLEDLWCFNEEVVVRAAADSEIPLISAVGHETDTTLIDYASDVRAPTPTAAAEMAVPVRAEIMAQVLDDARRMVAAMERMQDQHRVRLEGLARGLPEPARLLEQANQRLDAATDRMPGSMARFFERRSERVAALATQVPHPRVKMEQAAKDVASLLGRLKNGMAAGLRNETQRFAARDFDRRMQGGAARAIADATSRLGGLGKLLESLSYRRVLERGFALVRDAAGQPVFSAAGAAPGTGLRIEFSDGALDATVTGASADAPAPQPKPKPRAKPKGGSGGDDPQGSLL